MVRVITQETFDDVVRENMEEFEMSREEAVREAKEQFEQQGVNLSNIVISHTERHEVVAALDRLAADQPEGEKLAGLATLTTCAAQDLAQRVMATNHGAYSFLIRLAGAGESVKVRVAAVRALAAVMDTNPDHLEAQGITLIKELVSDGGEELLCPALDWLLACCVRHEENRQAVVAAPGLLASLEAVAAAAANATPQHQRDARLRVFRVWTALVQDDDVRVPFGKAHDHAREIVEQHAALKLLTGALKGHPEDREVLHLCLATLANLCVRNEYCQEVVDEGGLLVLHEILLNQRKEGELVTRALILIKVLAGNDKVKTDVAKAGGIPLIIAAITDNMEKPGAVEAGFQAVTAVTLRNGDNAQQMMECDGAYVVVTAMSRHPKHRKVQAACAAAIRNIVSRDKTLCQPFIDQGVEELLNTALAIHGKEVGDTLKSALRDLGLKVELIERWTGTKSAGLEQ